MSPNVLLYALTFDEIQGVMDDEEEYEEEEVPLRKPPRRRGRELLRAESMESEAEGGDQNAVMALLLQELVSINRARAQRKKQLQQSVRLLLYFCTSTSSRRPQ
jgi:hypothetical protein